MGRRPVGRRRLSVTLSLLATIGLLLGGAVTPASAAPGDPAGTGDEGANANLTLAQVLEQTGAAWLEAKALLDASKAKQTELTAQLQTTELELNIMNEQVSTIAAAAYRTGGLRTAAVLLASDSPDAFLSRAQTVSNLTAYNDRQLNRLNQLRKQQADAKAGIDAEVATQQQQFQVMAKKKEEAEKALVLAGGRATGGFVSASSPIAQPAPRNANGSWPTEKCIIDDLTTTGCSTARNMHAYKQAQAAGFKRFASCYRSGGPYEHPKGRACDYSSENNGFGGDATGDARKYGNDLAAFFVRNAERLGVMYVIWFRQIWTPAAGWHSYSGAGGDPSSDHTNHVHLSVL